VSLNQPTSIGNLLLKHKGESRRQGTRGRQEESDQVRSSQGFNRENQTRTLAPWLAIDSIVLARAGEVGALNSTSVSAEADSGPIRQYLGGSSSSSSSKGGKGKVWENPSIGNQED